MVKLNCFILGRAITLLKYDIYMECSECKYCVSKWPQLCNPHLAQDAEHEQHPRNISEECPQCQVVLTNLELNSSGIIPNVHFDVWFFTLKTMSVRFIYVWFVAIIWFCDCLNSIPMDKYMTVLYFNYPFYQ